MGLLDGMLGNVLGGMLGGNQQGGGGPLGSILGRLGGMGGNQPGMGQSIGGAAFMALALQLLQQNGGLSGVLDKFRGAGLGQHADSWVSAGHNLPITGDQIQDALGGGQLGQLARRFGLSTEQASDGLAQLMPELVNQMTPAGEVPADHNEVIAQALDQLKPVAGS